MFRVLEHELAIELFFYALFALKNHYGSRKKRIFGKSNTLALALTELFLPF
jgi:hypothetical protein